MLPQHGTPFWVHCRPFAMQQALAVQLVAWIGQSETLLQPHDLPNSHSAPFGLLVQSRQAPPLAPQALLAVP